MVAAQMIWTDLEAVAPEIVRLGAERFQRSRVALLGTLREDGSPTRSSAWIWDQLVARTSLIWHLFRAPWLYGCRRAVKLYKTAAQFQIQIRLPLVDALRIVSSPQPLKCARSSIIRGLIDTLVRRLAHESLVGQEARLGDGDLSVAASRSRTAFVACPRLSFRF